MSAASQSIRDAVETALAATPEARALFGNPLRLTDRPSRHLACPYLSWGRAQTRDPSADGVDLLELRQDLLVWAQDREGATRMETVLVPRVCGVPMPAFLLRHPLPLPGP